MSWMPVFASYAMPALLLLVLSLVTRVPRAAGRRPARVSSQRPKGIHSRSRRYPAVAGHGE
jgi:hypothetical protein